MMIWICGYWRWQQLQCHWHRDDKGWDRNGTIGAMPSMRYLVEYSIVAKKNADFTAPEDATSRFSTRIKSQTRNIRVGCFNELWPFICPALILHGDPCRVDLTEWFIPYTSPLAVKTCMCDIRCNMMPGWCRGDRLCTHVRTGTWEVRTCWGLRS